MFNEATQKLGNYSFADTVSEVQRRADALAKKHKCGASLAEKSKIQRIIAEGNLQDDKEAVKKYMEDKKKKIEVACRIAKVTEDISFKKFPSGSYHYWACIALLISFRTCAKFHSVHYCNDCKKFTHEHSCPLLFDTLFEHKDSIQLLADKNLLELELDDIDKIAIAAVKYEQRIECLVMGGVYKEVDICEA